MVEKLTVVVSESYVGNSSLDLLCYHQGCLVESAAGACEHKQILLR